MALTGQALLDAQLDLWQNTFAFVKSMALKCAVDLHIADTIQHHGGCATLLEIAAKAMVPPAKIPCLNRLMRVLTATGVFSTVQRPSSAAPGEQVLYTLTPASRLFIGSPNQVPVTAMILHSALVSSLFELGDWLRSEQPDLCMFKLRNNRSLFELAGGDPAFNAVINEGVASDTEFIMGIAIKECEEVFRGVGSLVDVAGGLGAAAHAISEAFPDVECSVLDLAHVVAKAPDNTGVRYVAGDMFESVPPANVTFLKWVLHDWGDEECITILKNRKEAIPPRDKGGKVVIIDIVIGAGRSDLEGEMQVVFDLYMMSINGTERDEEQWKKIFFKAGFSDYYKITPVLGLRSIIEVYP